MIIHQGKLWIICYIYSLYLKHQVVLSKYLFIIELKFVPDTFINRSIKKERKKEKKPFISTYSRQAPWHSQTRSSLL